MPPTCVSVVIPTFNGAQRLPHVFQALLAQTATNGSFEIIVVDNASTDNTGQVTISHPVIADLAKRDIACRLVKEPCQGLTYARICGVRAADSELICFLDDDNLPDADYVITGIQALEDSQVGMLVSSIRVHWAAEPPASVARRNLFAQNSFLGTSRIDFGAQPTIAPTVGAGLWIRRSAIQTFLSGDGSQRVFADRKGRRLTGGGDIELGVLVGRAGYKRLYVPDLKLTHCIPPTRLSTGYVCRLITGNVRSELTLRQRYQSLNYGWQRRIAAFASVLVAALASPLVLVTRKDGLREAIFIMAHRWAVLRGPYAYGEER
jgi:glycosyltransferase involved in cell wall biosynthesis